MQGHLYLYLQNNLWERSVADMIVHSSLCSTARILFAKFECPSTKGSCDLSNVHYYFSVFIYNHYPYDVISVITVWIWIAYNLYSQVDVFTTSHVITTFHVITSQMTHTPKAFYPPEISNIIYSFSLCKPPEHDLIIP